MRIFLKCCDFFLLFTTPCFPRAQHEWSFWRSSFFLLLLLEFLNPGLHVIDGQEFDNLPDAGDQDEDGQHNQEGEEQNLHGSPDGDGREGREQIVSVSALYGLTWPLYDGCYVLGFRVPDGLA